MEHANVKVFAKHADGVKLSDAILVFHRWIQDGVFPETLIDVADYSHVPAGPGVLLIGHEANYSLDNSRNRLGLLYARKTASDASAERVLDQSYDAALAACRCLEQETDFRGRLTFDPEEIEVTLNDRLLHPNTDEGWEAVRPEATDFLDRRFGGGHTLQRVVADPRERLTFTIRRSA